MTDGISLNDIEQCLEGIIPAGLTTVDVEGRPHLIHVSKVTYVDERHVAVSRQFFRSTARNLEARKRACILCTDPDTYQAYRLHLRWVRADTEGPVFEEMRDRVEAIASLQGMEEVFRAIAADVFEVERIEAVEDTLDEEPIDL